MPRAGHRAAQRCDWDVAERLLVRGAQGTPGRPCRCRQTLQRTGWQYCADARGAWRMRGAGAPTGGTVLAARALRALLASRASGPSNSFFRNPAALCTFSFELAFCRSSVDRSHSRPLSHPPCSMLSPLQSAARAVGRQERARCPTGLTHDTRIACGQEGHRVQGCRLARARTGTHARTTRRDDPLAPAP